MKFNNVFVVDDDKVHHFIIRKLLEKNNIRTNPSFFENGYDALKEIKDRLNSGENQPDLILLDINMPVLDGWQFLEEFNEIKKGFNDAVTIHIISSSEGYFNSDRINEFTGAFDSYFVKPMTSDTIKTIFNL